MKLFIMKKSVNYKKAYISDCETVSEYYLNEGIFGMVDTGGIFIYITPPPPPPSQQRDSQRADLTVMIRLLSTLIN